MTTHKDEYKHVIGMFLSDQERYAIARNKAVVLSHRQLLLNNNRPSFKQTNEGNNGNNKYCYSLPLDSSGRRERHLKKSHEFYRRDGAVWEDVYHTPPERMHLVGVRPDLENRHELHVQQRIKKEKETLKQKAKRMYRVKQQVKERFDLLQCRNIVLEAKLHGQSRRAQYPNVVKRAIQELDRGNQRRGKPPLSNDHVNGAKFRPRTNPLWANFATVPPERLHIVISPRQRNNDAWAVRKIQHREISEDECMKQKERLKQDRIRIIREDFKSQLQANWNKRVAIGQVQGRPPRCSSARHMRPSRCSSARQVRSSSTSSDTKSTRRPQSAKQRSTSSSNVTQCYSASAPKYPKGRSALPPKAPRVIPATTKSKSSSHGTRDTAVPLFNAASNDESTAENVPNSRGTAKPSSTKWLPQRIEELARPKDRSRWTRKANQFIEPQNFHLESIRSMDYSELLYCSSSPNIQEYLSHFQTHPANHKSGDCNAKSKTTRSIHTPRNNCWVNQDNDGTRLNQLSTGIANVKETAISSSQLLEPEIGNTEGIPGNEVVKTSIETSEATVTHFQTCNRGMSDTIDSLRPEEEDSSNNYSKPCCSNSSQQYSNQPTARGESPDCEVQSLLNVEIESLPSVVHIELDEFDKRLELDAKERDTQYAGTPRPPMFYMKCVKQGKVKSFSY